MVVWVGEGGDMCSEITPEEQLRWLNTFGKSTLERTETGYCMRWRSFLLNAGFPNMWQTSWVVMASTAKEAIHIMFNGGWGWFDSQGDK